MRTQTALAPLAEEETLRDLKTEALCHPPTVHYSDGNNEHITANTSSISRAQCNRWETRTILVSIPQDLTYSIEDTSVHSILKVLNHNND